MQISTHTRLDRTIDSERLAYPHVGKQSLQLSLGDKIGGIGCNQLQIARERERERERERGGGLKDGVREREIR